MTTAPTSASIRTPQRIAIQGELGSFSHEATLAILPNATLIPCVTAADVFSTLQAANPTLADAAVVPIENSLAGSVVEFYDLLSHSDIVIVAEKLLRIRHNLIARPGIQLAQLTRVLSHPIALAQCRKLFVTYPHLQATPHYDTAGAVQTILQPDCDPSFAAIASRQAAAQYGGEIVFSGIEDNPENFTRFLLLQRMQDARIDPAHNKMSLVFFLENRSGALVEALRIFSVLMLNLTKIESRPVPGRPWEYMFCIDVQLPTPEAADIALAQLRLVCPHVKELGRYRAAS